MSLRADLASLHVGATVIVCDERGRELWRERVTNVGERYIYTHREWPDTSPGGSYSIATGKRHGRREHIRPAPKEGT